MSLQPRKVEDKWWIAFIKNGQVFLLDNGDGAVRSGKAGFPGAYIPANCSGTVTFERKEPQTTLPVKPYQLVIDSCRVIEQSSGEMEMHLALIVDGYKFVETGFNFNQLPNSTAQLALPEWKLESQPASPVSLIPIDVSNNKKAAAVQYSDGTKKLLTNAAGDTMYIVNNEGYCFMYAPEDCDDTAMTFDNDTSVEQGVDTIPYSAYLDSCSLADDMISGNVVLIVDGVSFVKSNVSAEPADSFRILMQDFVLQ